MSKADPLALVLHKVELLAKVDGEDVPVTVVIRKPFECLDTQWLCAANISGLFHRKADMERATPVESIEAARSFVIDELSGYVAGGGQLYTTKHKPVTDLHSIIPKKLRHGF